MSGKERGKAYIMKKNQKGIRIYFRFGCAARLRSKNCNSNNCMRFIILRGLKSGPSIACFREPRRAGGAGAVAARGALLRVEVKERVLHLGRAAAAASAARSTITHDGTFASSLCSNRFWEFPNTSCKSDFPANMAILPPTS